jgi:hypothetical protein
VLSGVAGMAGMVRGGLLTVLLYPRTFVARCGVSGVMLDILRGVTEETTRSFSCTNKQTRRR